MTDPTCDRRDEPPPDDDPELRRVCNRCNLARDWVVPRCPNCGGQEFRMISPAKEND